MTIGEGFGSDPLRRRFNKERIHVEEILLCSRLSNVPRLMLKRGVCS